MTKILKIEEKTDKNSNPMKVCQMENNTTVYVNSKYDSAIYPLVEEGKDVEVVQDGQFNKIMPESLGVKFPERKPKGGFIKEAQERKATQISSFQKNKEENIIISSACRDATIITTEHFKAGHYPVDNFKEKWLEWRAWLYEQYKKPSSDYSIPFE